MGRAVLVFQFVGGNAFGDDGGVPAVTLVLFVHKAILAAGAGFLASVPGIPWYRMPYLFILHG